MNAETDITNKLCKVEPSPAWENTDPLNLELMPGYELRRDNRNLPYTVNIEQERKEREEAEKIAMEEARSDLNLMIKIRDIPKYYLSNDAVGICIIQKIFDKDTGVSKNLLIKMIHIGHIKNITLINSGVHTAQIYEVNIQIGDKIKIIIGNIDDIASEMNKISGCMLSRELKDAISGILGFCEDKGLVYIRKEVLVNAYGFYFDEDTKSIKEKDIYSNTRLLKNVSIEQLRSGLDALRAIIDYYKKNDEHHKKLVNDAAVKIIAPFGYARKQKGKLTVIEAITGPSGTGKSLMGCVSRWIWGVKKEDDVYQSGATISTGYQLANHLNKSTFQLQADESNALLENISHNGELSELIKNHAEMIGTIRERKGSSFIGYSSLCFTANFPLKISSDALRLKISFITYDESEKHTAQERAEAINLCNKFEPELLFVGSYLAKQVLSNNPLYVEKIFLPDYTVGAIKILKQLCLDAGIIWEMPDPIGMGIYDSEDNDDIIEILLKHIKKEIFDIARTARGRDDLQTTLTLETAWGIAKNANNLPLGILYHENTGKILIPSREVTRYLSQKEEQSFEIGALQQSAIKHNLEFVKGKSFRIAGKVVGKSGILMPESKLIGLLSSNLDADAQETL